MIGSDLSKIKESKRADDLLVNLKKEEMNKRFYIIKIGKTEIRTTSKHRMEEYIKLHRGATIKVLEYGE